MSRVRRYALLSLLFTPLVGCAQCAPGKVGTGVARLSIRNFGAMVELVSADTACGFEAAHVKDAVTLSAAPGDEGTATYSVEQCTIDIPAAQAYQSEDCNGVVFTIHGRFTFSGKKHVAGIITGDVDTPVIPGGPDAATIFVEDVAFEEFVVESSASPNILRMISGNISGRLQPRLGVDTDVGACSIPTKNAMITDVAYAPGSLVHVTTDSREFEVPVDGSLLFAVNGKHSGHENMLSGSVVVWGGEEQVPTSGDEQGLDPDYDPATFESSYACKAGLVVPARFDCEGFLGPRLAQNAARLTIRAVGRLASALEADTVCGFSSPSVQQTAVLDGPVGSLGTATLTTQSCTLDFGKATVLQTSCTGSETIASGRVTLRGVKRITGRLTGDEVTPVVPITESPAEISIEVEAFANLEIAENGSAMVFETGALAGVVRPMVVADTAKSGLCAFTSAIARFNEVKYVAPTSATIKSTSGSFAISMDDANLMAVNGTWGPDTNILDGSIVVDGEPYQLPTDPADDGLDPEFDQAAFDAGWQCGTVQLPVSTMCEPTPALAQGAAQLSIQTIGKLAQVLDADQRCGFTSPEVLNSANLTGELGRPGGRIVFAVTSPCAFDFGEKTEIATDCNGKRVYASGRVRMTGTKTINGIVSGDPLEPIVPTTWEPATLDIDARFDGFALWADPEVNILELASGGLTGRVQPRVAVDTNTGACSISTPTARFTDVAYDGANVTVIKDGLRFGLDVARSTLGAQNGVGTAQSNHLSGDIVVGGTTYPIPVSGPAILDPEYDQAVFDASYACVPDMVVPTQSNQCDMKRVLAEGVARLLALTSGTVASEINKDSECGFEDFWVKTSPSRVVGDSGDQGLIEWDIQDCRHQNNGTNPVYVDCYGRQRFLDADVTLDARRTITGERETILVIVDSIIPNAHDAVQIALQDIDIARLELWEREGNLSQPFRGIRMDGGRLSAVVQPILGENADTRGRYDIPTPVVHITELRLANAPVTVNSEGKTFKFTVDQTAVEAFNGSWSGKGMTNYLTGSVTIDGEQIALGILPLDPAFTQSDFDARYVCTNALVSLIPPE